jgi:hypothetical protein
VAAIVQALAAAEDTPEAVERLLSRVRAATGERRIADATASTLGRVSRSPVPSELPGAPASASDANRQTSLLTPVRRAC